MENGGSSQDRRSRRSEKRLKQSFAELMKEKGFTAMTVRSIAERADVNRGTFYTHYPDKYALLEQSIRDKLHLRLQQHLPPEAGWNSDHLRMLAVILLEHFRSLHGRCSPVDTINPVFERTMQQEIKALITTWLQRLEPEDFRWNVPLDTVALGASWTLYGAALEWSRGTAACPAEETAGYIVQLIIGGTA
ncbi:AcrR family transcriptional regulator [Paenibacillus rhizosphaerae]|uniref:AcrR family transcriptional regulator n=1 Tax=Paenibacillus rhizosphaerae TaxID=297318 RepID=A0A839TUN9_9BACL|nr:TetR/AcrR family transcriptional regulator [Paenibacillus rhizosphaerae]MBB3128989.1 AcrR family transcriptional regulator [Paenibacillus rhizosphaerae]